MVNRSFVPACPGAKRGTALKNSELLQSTRLVNPEGKFTLTFKVPAMPPVLAVSRNSTVMSHNERRYITAKTW